jgi:hypothetical protein
MSRLVSKKPAMPSAIRRSVRFSQVIVISLRR